MKKTLSYLVILIAGLLFPTSVSLGQAKADHPVIKTENYYKIIPGHQQEFLQLFMKNHYPLLEKGLASGRLLSVKVETPAVYMSEDVRWDFRVTTTSRGKPDPAEEAALKKQLWPDQETFNREEKQRFDFALAHWDVTVTDLTPPAKQ